MIRHLPRAKTPTLEVSGSFTKSTAKTFGQDGDGRDSCSQRPDPAFETLILTKKPPSADELLASLVPLQLLATGSQMVIWGLLL